MSYASNAFGWFRRVAKPVVGHCTAVRQQHTFVQALMCAHGNMMKILDKYGDMEVSSWEKIIYKWWNFNCHLW